MNKPMDYIQHKWRSGLLPGVNCILYEDGKVVIANTYTMKDNDTNQSQWYWTPLCDTTIDSLEKYESDAWTNIDIFHGAIKHGEDTIVFGDGSMGSDGFVASTDKNGQLKWGIFFTFSNPIVSARVENGILICTSELDSEIHIKLDDLTQISIVQPSY